MVGAPDTGFIFPAFSDRSSDIHSLIYYIKDAKDSRPEFVENVFGCGSKRTATEQQQVFSSIVKQALAPVRDDSEEVLLQLQEKFHEISCPDEEEIYEEQPPVILTGELIDEVLTEHHIIGETAEHIKEGISREFESEPPALQNLIDEKALEKNARKKEEEHLRLQVQQLQKELAEKTSSAPENLNDPDEEAPFDEHCDVILRIKPEKASLIKSEMIDGRKCLIIPVDEYEQINLNGVTREV